MKMMNRPKDYRELLIILDSRIFELKQAIREKIAALDSTPEQNNEVAKVHHTHKIIKEWFAKGGILKRRTK